MIEEYFAKPDDTVRRVIEHMEQKNIKGICIVNDSRKLLGLFTYGDMRHFFLHDGDMAKAVRFAMNVNPYVFYSTEEVERYREHRKMVMYPVIDKDRRVINVIYENDYNAGQMISNALEHVPLVIMAGGKGTRLHPYTKILPKALIPIGDVTITERIIHGFRMYGCREVHLILNYKANMIRSYFEDIERDYSIFYEVEDAFLGTAGGLKLLKGKAAHTFFVSNCDILIDADFECIYKMHKQQQNKITFVCAMKNLTIPYGVVETDTEGNIQALKEKPELSFLTNTGLYVIEPDVLGEIAEEEIIHLPDLAKRVMKKGMKVGIFPITEKAWMDMGQFKEMETMIKQLGI